MHLFFIVLYKALFLQCDSIHNYKPKTQNKMKTQNENSARSAKESRNSKQAREARIINNESRKKAEAAKRAQEAKQAAKAAEAAEKEARKQEAAKKRETALFEAASKAQNWRNTNGLKNKASGQEKSRVLSAAVAILQGKDSEGENYTYLYNVVFAAASNDFRLVLPVIPAAVLASAVYRDGSIKPASVARAVAVEIASNKETALAAAQAAQDAQRAQAAAAKKAAKKAALQAKREAKQASKAQADSKQGAKKDSKKAEGKKGNK